jgi:hypothetical protein
LAPDWKSFINDFNLIVTQENSISDNIEKLEIDIQSQKENKLNKIYLDINSFENYFKDGILD